MASHRLVNILSELDNRGDACCDEDFQAIEKQGASLSVPLTVDLLHSALYADGNPYEVWRAMREVGPVHHQVAKTGSEFWAVVGHEAGKRVLTDWKVFTSTRGTTLREDDNSAPYPGAGKMPVLTDPPRHTDLRRAVAPLFTPRAVEKLGALAREVAGSLLADLRERGGGDFVTDVAAKFPLAVQAEILGIPPGDIPLILDATGRSVDEAEHGSAGHHDVMTYYLNALGTRRGDAGRDLIGMLLEARAGGLPLSDEEIVLTCDNIVVAASQTAQHAASGGLLALLEHPAAWEALREGRVGVDSAIEELLRWTAPATHVMRTAVCDTELAGTTIRAGDALAVWIASANRDGTVFADPEELVLDRRPNPHLTLGAGMHFCLGAALVRVLLRALLEDLIRADTSLALANPPDWQSNWVVNALRSLPVTVVPA
ncbi:cytochrome P450 [Streptomyces atratus]|uniref:cytochrome P450 n=1 Tax=Streptomyces atratus TaxID=1893 RepID=UPI002259EC9C|nr:cytochrome P450 [Streptomyces atratus]MCX5345149.1 cytochrome P450 [Streptomyces atratus]